MTVALLSTADGNDESEGLDVLRRWASFARQHGHESFVIAPAAVAIPQESGLHHVAAKTILVDQLLALADIAREGEGDLWVVDPAYSGPPNWDRCLAVPANQTPAAAVALTEHANVAVPPRSVPVFEQVRRVAEDAGINLDGVVHPDATYDGWYERYVVRRVATPLVVKALRWHIGPAPLTVISCFAMLAASLLGCAGPWPALALAGVLVQSAVLVNCVRDEVAAIGQRATPFNQWFDAVTRPLMVATLVAGLAVGRDWLDDDIWLIANIAILAIISSWLTTAAIATKLRQDTGDVRWAVSGSEMLLFVSLTLVLGMAEATVLLIALVSFIATAVTLLGFILRPSDEPIPAYVDRKRRNEIAHDLFEQCDPGPLSMLVGREDPHLSLLRRGTSSRFAVAVPLLTWLVEASALMVVTRWQNQELLPLAAVLLAVLAFHRLDIYARRHFAGHAPAEWVFMLSVGALGRPVIYLVLAATDALSEGLVVATVAWAVLFAVESASAWSEKKASSSDQMAIS